MTRKWGEIPPPPHMVATSDIETTPLILSLFKCIFMIHSTIIWNSSVLILESSREWPPSSIWWLGRRLVPEDIVVPIMWWDAGMRGDTPSSQDFVQHLHPKFCLHYSSFYWYILLKTWLIKCGQFFYQFVCRKHILAQILAKIESLERAEGNPWQ